MFYAYEDLGKLIKYRAIEFPAADVTWQKVQQLSALKYDEVPFFGGKCIN